MFFKKKYDIEFADMTREAYIRTPIQRAQDVKPKYFEDQKKKYDRLLFSQCPGMFDQYKAGYIIPAWTDIDIKANKAGVVTILNSGNHHSFHKPRPMDEKVCDGIYTPENAAFKITHVGSPWSVFTDKNISAFLMPAVYHSSFLDDLYVWSGIVDYNKFHSLNFIFSPKRECEVHIKAGDPLLQVIPFYNKNIRSGFGPASDHQRDENKNYKYTSKTQFYRKHSMVKKFFGLENTNNEDIR